MIGVAAILAAGLLHAAMQSVVVEDPALRRAVERFYETQQSEDVEGYLALWSAKAQRPTPEQLKFVFDSGDDKFPEIEITRVVVEGSRARVRVAVRRERTAPARVPGGPPLVFNSLVRAALTFEREADEWKLLREGPAGDDLAAQFIEAGSAAEREKLLADEPDLVGPPLLAALGRLGSAATTSMNYRRAQTIFEQLIELARRTGYKKEEGEALQNTGNALYYQRRFPEALAMFQQRLDLERERGDDAAVAAALAGIATIRYSLAEYSDALMRYREALAIQERLDDVAGIAYTSLNIGNIKYLQGDFPAAIAAYRRSLDLHRTMSHSESEALSLEGLGRVYTAQGDYSAALEVFQQVLSDPRLERNRTRLGSASQNIGDVHFRLGNLEAARASFEQSRAHFEAQKDMANVGRVLQSLGLTDLVVGRYTAAEDLYKRSESTCAAVTDKECAARAWVGFAYTQAAQEKFFDAAASYRRAIAEFMALGGREEAARAEVGLSQALTGAEDYAGAIVAATNARHTALAIDSDDVIWRALTAEARAVRRLGDKDRALGIARAAVLAVTELESAAVDKPATAATTDAAAAFATYAVLQAENGDAAGAFATSERLRGLDIRAGLATNERDIARGMTPEEREQERALASELTTQLARLTRERELPKPDAAQIAALEKVVDEAREKRRAFLDGLFERLPDLRLWRGLSPPATAADAAPLLDDKTVVLSFVLDEDDVLVFTLTRAERSSTNEGDQAAASANTAASPVLVESHLLAMKRRTIAERVALLQQPAVVGNPAAWQKAIADIAAIIPPSAWAKVERASRVAIVPQDVLWRVPFAALPSGSGVLIDHASVAVGGSLTGLLRAAAAPHTVPDSLLAIGAPELAAATIDRLKQVAPGWPLRTQEAAEIEIGGIAHPYASARAEQLTRAAATESGVRARMGDTAVLHVAAPFRINAASPLFSSVLLARADPSAAQDRSNDGALELREIVTLPLRAEVAVFSDGGATSMRDGAAAADVLHWGWLAAGVPSVMLSRWTTPSPASDRLLAEFHTRLSTGASAADALRGAQLAIRESAETSAPIYWAAWMVVGR